MLIALSGYAGAGKDTVGEILVAEHGYRRVAFADRLKLMAVNIDPILEIEPDLDTAPYKAKLSHIIAMYGSLDQAKQLTGVRAYLQTLGVSARDCIGPDVWVDAALRCVGAREDVVITDCRFRNEARAVTARGGKVVRITRPGVAAVNGHVSEHDLDDWQWDAEILNSGTIDELAGFVDVAARMLGTDLIGSDS